MTSDSSSEDLDRVVSRRVDKPTPATADDEPAYIATGGPEPAADTATGGTGSTTERAARDQAAENEDEPTRSE